MKNLFKNLMLVAVAAMAFTACSQDVNEVNNVERVTRYEFTANIADDTRSGFVGKNEAGNAYVSEWHEGDQVMAFIDNYGAVTTDIDTEGNFALELTNAPEPFFMTVCSPAEAWTEKTSWTVPTEQTPLANSVDPKAHILRSTENILVSNGTPNEKIVMSHYASYGKMTVNGVNFKINKVEVSFNDGQVYTINATNVENNTFWFAISDNLTVSEFTVTAYGEGDAVVTKTVTIPEDRELKFNWGRVSTFSVKDLEAIEVEPEAPKNLVFTSASWTNTKLEDKFVQFYTEDGATLQLNWYECGRDNWIVPNTYGFADSGAIYWGSQFSWYENSAFGIDAEIAAGTVVVSVVDGKYHIEFTNLADWDGNVYIESATFTGQISGLVVPDTRTILAAPTATATADGNVITISWNVVTGANEYYVSCTNGGLDAITTTDTSVTIEAEYSTKYDFSIKAVAHDSNPDYKTSGVYNFSIITGENPNVEYISLTSMSKGVYEDASYNYRFTFKGDNSEFILAWSYKKATDTTITSGDYAYNSYYSMLDGFGNVFGANNTYKFDGINAKINGGTIKVSSEGNIYTITMNLSLNSGDVKLFKYVGEIGVTSEPDPTPDPEPEPEPDPDQPGDGGDDNTGEDFSNWSFSASLNQGNKVLTLTDGTRTVEMTLNKLEITSFYADSSKSNYFTNVKVDGVSKTASADSYVKLARSGWTYSCTISLTINGVPYTGSGSLTF